MFFPPLEEILRVVEGVQIVGHLEKPFTLRPHEVRPLQIPFIEDVVKYGKSGWFLMFALYVKGPGDGKAAKLRVVMKLSYYTLDVSFEDLMKWRLKKFWGPFTISYLDGDPVQDEYAAIFTPLPWVPLSPRLTPDLEIRLNNSYVDGEVTGVYTTVAYIVQDEEKYRDSLAEYIADMWIRVMRKVSAKVKAMIEAREITEEEARAVLAAFTPTLMPITRAVARGR